MNIAKLGGRCCGCGVCAAICPVKCIEMKPDAEGFLAPRVDAKKCSDCGVCLSRCPVEQAKPEASPKTPATYAAHALSDADLLESSSGAVFTLLARETLKNGGRVYGAVMDAPGCVRIVGTDDEAGIAPMRKSKYVQGTVDAKTYAEVKQTLDEGRSVLFTGCPCQTAAIRAYLRKPYDNLVTAEIVCHGVPSPLLFKTYLQSIEGNGKDKVSSYVFRDKSKGWGMFFSYQLGGKNVCKRSTFDPFMNNFMNGRVYRESCYQCAFARQDRSADLTLGDFWGVLKEYPQFYDARGLSAVLVNGEKGEKAFEAIKDSMESHEVEFARVARHNANMVKPSKRPEARDHIYEGLGTIPTREYVKRRLKVVNTPQEALKALFPAKLKQALKRLLRR